VTYAPFGVSTAAELFIFLSGLVFGLSYERVLRTHGYVRLHTRCFVRAWQIYLLHVACLVFTLGALSMLGQWLGAGDAPDIFPAHGLSASNEMLTAFLQLQQNPQYFDILPLYIVLMLFVPFLFPLLHRAPWAGLGVSALVWGLVQWASATGAALPFFQALYYSPLAWQLLFVIGIAAGFRATQGKPLPRLEGKTLLVALVALVIAALWYKGARINAIVGWFGNVQYVSGQGVPFDLPLIDKPTLGPLRLLHFLLLATLVAQLVPGRDSSQWRSAVCRTLALCGRNGLEMFVVGVVLTYMIGAVMLTLGGGPAMMLSLDLAGIVMLLACAHVVSWRKGEPWRMALPEATHVTPTPFSPGAYVSASRHIRS